MIKVSIATLFTALLVLSLTINAQICQKYKIVPDSVIVDSVNTFFIQEILGPGQPPGLWVCNWIDFENNGIQNCINSSSCSYMFTTGGLRPVAYQINEPFLGNTEVCTSYVFVDACNASLSAKANNHADTLYICSGATINLTAALSDPLSCSGNWEYAWFNGNTYYDGLGFFSLVETWGTGFQSINNLGISSSKTFKVKARCTAGSNCKDSSQVFVGISALVQHPVFNTGLPVERCMGLDTLGFPATALNADSVIYTINGAAAGNIMNNQTGVLIFDSLFHGTTLITATAYGCNGPLSTSHQITTHPLPAITLNLQDTVSFCIGDTLVINSLLSGTAPFSLRYLLNATTDSLISGGSLNFNLAINDSLTHLHFYELSDAHCTRQLNIIKHILASPVPVYTPLSDTTLCHDEGILLDLGTTNYSFLWSHDNSTAGSAYIDTTLSSINMGLNTIDVLIVNNYCTVAESVNIHFSLCTDAEAVSFENDNIMVFPNPSTGKFVLLLGELINSQGILRIYDMTGKIYLQEEIKSHTHTFNIENPGLYILKIDTSAGMPIIKKLSVLKP